MKSAKLPSLQTRAAGILLHITSLPGPYGSGDLGDPAYRFADALHQAGMRWWQVLPITPPGPGPGFSPYSSYSAFAGSPWLISPQLLHEQGLLSGRDLKDAQKPLDGRINFAEVQRLRAPLLRTAFANRLKLSRGERDQYEQFGTEQSRWLDDYALFAALKEQRGTASWTRWPEELRLRVPAALDASRRRLHEPVAFHKFLQWLFDRQWSGLKLYCNQRGIGLIGDIPVFVAHDSADVWANPTLFLLNRDGRPKVISGYPADAFAPRGQRWGHPHYRWPAHIANEFAWWLARFTKALRDFNAIRIDHFLGFYRLWAVAASARHAVQGRWMRVPGDQLFSILRKRIGDAPIIAEDLGSPVAAQLALRDKFKFPGMRILQFGFGGNDYHLPHVYPRRCVAYTGTHDNQTIVGWFENLGTEERDRAIAYVGNSKTEQHWNFVRALFTSVADTVIIPVQDALGLGAADRMNVPGVAVGNWGWRMDGPMPRSVIAKLRALSRATGRSAP